jgi:hypothetical protein
MNNRLQVVRDTQFKNAEGEVLGVIPKGLMLKRVENVGGETVVMYGGNKAYVSTEDVILYMDTIYLAEEFKTVEIKPSANLVGDLKKHTTRKNKR